jgi:hypothetical protein
MIRRGGLDGLPWVGGWEVALFLTREQDEQGRRATIKVAPTDVDGVFLRLTHYYSPVCEEPVSIAGDVNACLECIFRQTNHPTSATGTR